jgi:hypothetical protein
MAAKPDLGAQIVSYGLEMQDFHKMFEALLAHPDTVVDLEVNGSTASSIAAAGANWKV